jgi:hypothetical protein
MIASHLLRDATSRVFNKVQGGIMNRPAIIAAPRVAEPIVYVTEPTVYLAGKIGKNDWREDLVGPGIVDRLDPGNPERPALRSAIHPGLRRLPLRRAVLRRLRSRMRSRPGQSRRRCRRLPLRRSGGATHQSSPHIRNQPSPHRQCRLYIRIHRPNGLLPPNSAKTSPSRSARILTFKDVKELWMARMCATVVFDGWPVGDAWKAFAATHLLKNRAIP